jgi:hypothetical protein
MSTSTTNLTCKRDRECCVDYVLLYENKPFLKFNMHLEAFIDACFQELDIETMDFAIHHFLFNILKGKMDDFLCVAHVFFPSLQQIMYCWVQSSLWHGAFVGRQKHHVSYIAPLCHTWTKTIGQYFSWR